MRIHFVGIGGIGMSGIARVLVEMGYTVSGSDLRLTHITQMLEKMGVRVFQGHAAPNVNGAEMVVVSSAIARDNPEILEARAKSITILQRAEMLGFLMKWRYGIAIAGTHGKTTTTSLIAAILEQAKKDPTVIVGGELNGPGYNAKLGQSPFLVAEADESDASFLKLFPRIAVVTNIDADVNPSLGPYATSEYDYERTMQRVREVFLEFLRRIPREGDAVLCADCSNLNPMVKELRCSVLTYGIDSPADLRAERIRFAGMGSEFSVVLNDAARGGPSLGKFTLPVPGKHNVLNALAAVGVGLKLNIPVEDIRAGLSSFAGVKRRFEVLGEIGGIMVVDDYAHNPTKIKAALSAAKQGFNRRTVAVFQPHRFTRTRLLKHEFAQAFTEADILLVTEIYAAGEAPIPGVTGQSLTREIQKAFPEKPIFFLPTPQDLLNQLRETVKQGDLVITLGAGDIYELGVGFLEDLRVKS